MILTVSRPSPGALLLLICMVATPSPSFAVDGALEINQACAVNSGCFDGDTAGFPVTINAPGAYTLTSSLSVTAVESAIRISANVSGVTIDLNGFEVVGPVVCTGEGSSIDCVGDPGVSFYGVGAPSGDRGTTVRNGTVRGFRWGIRIGTQALVADVFASSNSQNGLSVDQGVVSRCRARANGGTGINLNAASIIENSHARGNGNHGIFANIGSTVTSNTVYQNGGNGIQTSLGVTVRGNAAYENEGFGLQLAGGSGYSENVLYLNNGGNANPQVSGGIQMGTNICGVAACP
jgi:hypothetical protein